MISTVTMSAMSPSRRLQALPATGPAYRVGLEAKNSPSCLSIVPEAEASAVADTHRRQIGDLQIPTATGMLNLTCSFGIASWRHGDDINKMLKRADTALYQAKASGRNCVVRHSGAAEREVA